MKKLIIAALLFTTPALAWDGYDWENGEYIEIESGNLVREGQEIEVYNWDSGEYEYYDVENINNNFGDVELEVYDWNSGEYKYFDMD